MHQLTTLIDGLCFAEGPRWRDGRLWFSDMHAGQVLAVDPEGLSEVVVTLDDDWPSGLGWLPSGDLLIVSMRRRQLLRFDGSHLHLHADLMALASFYCNDMVVDDNGIAWVGNFGFDMMNRAPKAPAEIIRVSASGAATVAATDLHFPNGSVITPDGKTLIVGESMGGRLTAFDISSSGQLENRRVWAACPKGAVPDGICLDAGGGIWVASPSSNECLRIEEGGQVTERIETGRGTYACMLGGDDGRTLHILVADTADPAACAAQRSGAIVTTRVQLAAAGRP